MNSKTGEHYTICQLCSYTNPLPKKHEHVSPKGIRADGKEFSSHLFCLCVCNAKMHIKNDLGWREATEEDWEKWNENPVR